MRFRGTVYRAHNPEWAASQRLADRLVAAGYVGMLVGSFAVGANKRDLNLVMWRWGDAHPTRVALVDEEGRLTPPFRER